MERFVGDNDHGNYEFYSIIMAVTMALATSRVTWGKTAPGGNTAPVLSAKQVNIN